MKRSLAAFLAISMLLAVLVGCGKKAEEKSDTYTLGVAIPLTGMGSSIGKWGRISSSIRFID